MSLETANDARLCKYLTIYISNIYKKENTTSLFALTELILSVGHIIVVYAEDHGDSNCTQLVKYLN